MKYLFVILTCLSIFPDLNAQSESPVELNENETGLIVKLNSDALSFYKTSRNFLESPFHFDDQDMILSGIIAGATAFSFAFDNPVRDGISEIKSSSLKKITSFGEDFGDGKYAAALSGVLFLSGHIAGNRELRKTGLILAEAIFLNGIVTEGLKVIFGRSRPFLNRGNGKIEFLEMEFEDEENSLPSGHTSTAFTIATVLSQRIKNTYASIALYSLAGLTAFQRIYADKHWISDTILGAALGTVIGLKVVKLNSEIEDEDSSIAMNISPIVGKNSYGIGFFLNF